MECIEHDGIVVPQSTLVNKLWKTYYFTGNFLNKKWKFRSYISEKIKYFLFRAVEMLVFPWLVAFSFHWSVS